MQRSDIREFMAQITLIEAVTQALAYEMQRDDSVVVLGEDVGVNGGVFRATVGLQQKFGEHRVIDTPLDETTIAGLTVGLAAQGMKTEDMKKMDLNRLRAGQRDQAVQEVKAALLLEKIAEEEKIEVVDAEIDREVEALAEQSKQTPEAIRSRLTRDGALDRIRNRIRSEKTLEFLYHQSA